MLTARITHIYTSPPIPAAGIYINVSWRYGTSGPFTNSATNLFVSSSGSLAAPIYIHYDETINNIQIKIYDVSCPNSPFFIIYTGDDVHSTTTTTSSTTIGELGLRILGRFTNPEVVSYTATAPSGFSHADITKTIPAHNIMSSTSEADATASALLYVTKLATAQMYKDMKTSTPYIGGGWNSTVGTGSMTQGSNILTLTSPMSLSIGDDVIVEMGGESGHGIRGTVGVGGQWPYYIYNNTAAMMADTSQVDGFYAGNLQDGKVYRWQNGDSGFSWNAYTHWPYYLEKIIPHALDRVTVTAISMDGLTVTLSKPAVVATTNANVYFDHFDLITTLMSAGATTTVPAGKFAVSRVLNADRHVTINFTGADINQSFLFSPRGCTTFSLQMNGIWDPTSRPDHLATVKHLTIIGNAGDNYFRFDEADTDGERLWETTAAFSSTSQLTNNPTIYVQAVGMSSYYGVVQDVRVIDGLGYAIQTSVAACSILDCEVILTEEEHAYIGWQIHTEGDQELRSGEVGNNLFISYKLAHSFELFKTQNIHLHDNRLINGITSSNSVSNCLIEHYWVNNTKDALSTWVNSGNAFIEQNGFFLDGQDGNVYRNILIEQIAMGDDGLMQSGLFCRLDTPNTEVHDFEMVHTDGTDAVSPIGIHLEASNALIENANILGGLGPSYYLFPTIPLERSSISIFQGNQVGLGVGLVTNSKAATIRVVPGAHVTNCIADLIVQF